MWNWWPSASRSPGFELDAAALIGFSEAEHVPFDGAALRRGAADTIFRHRIESALGAALDRLPAFDRLALGRRHQRDLLSTAGR